LVNSLLIFWKNLYCQHVGTHPYGDNYFIGRRCDAATGNACYWPQGKYGDNRGSSTNGHGAAEEQCALGVDDEASQITETLKHKRFDNSQGDDDIVELDLSYDKIQDKFKDKDIPFDFDEMTGDIYEIGKVTHNYKEEGRFKITKLVNVHGEDIALDAKTNTCGGANQSHYSLDATIQDTMKKFTNKAGNDGDKKIRMLGDL